MQHKAYVRAMSCEEICPENIALWYSASLFSGPGIPTQGRINTPMDQPVPCIIPYETMVCGGCLMLPDKPLN